LRIDSTRYTKFWSNPERYRLSQLWNLDPILPAPGTMARKFLLGRMRGSCLHELLDSGIPSPVYTPQELAAAEEMADLVKHKYIDEEVLCVEKEFEYHIPDSSHVMVGRIDRIVLRNDKPIIVDYKSCGKCTKTELKKRIEGYRNSAQVPFYMVGATTLGYPVLPFQYRIVQKDRVTEDWATYTNEQLHQFVRGVHNTCEIIERMIASPGVDEPWPILPEKFMTGFEPILGKRLVPGVMPEGFEERKEHLSIIENHLDGGRLT
jgi:PD-(D/E)XK nuclease superfamily